MQAAYRVLDTDGKVMGFSSNMTGSDVSTIALHFGQASMLAVGVLSSAAAFWHQNWTAVLSASICMVAWSVYGSMIKVSDPVRKHLRFLDWMVRPPPAPSDAGPHAAPLPPVTLPLLAPKLAAMARVGTGTTTGFWAGPYLDLTVGLLAFATIALSYFAVAGFNVTVTELNGSGYIVFALTYIGSFCTMGGAMGIIYALAGQTGTANLANILSFSIPWAGYAVVYLVQANMAISVHVCDVLYTVLDVYSKAVFGLVTVFNLF